ncbi:hypothetical protein EJ02DRAFT_508580 [Clathrospora elynae]|uniref:Uncharacterized protein n=1 Tax=Clathrospora elynae TaxID=706981 RepID=A0A6A5TCT2_9PLEO|nr:hypothetical protein EJ02DRAFT_508580 [Clathrospora elynae]
MHDEFQNDVTDAIITIYETENWYPEEDSIITIYDGTIDGSPVRRLMRCGFRDWIDMLDMLDNLPSYFFQDALREILRDRKPPSRYMTICGQSGCVSSRSGWRQDRLPK